MTPIKDGKQSYISSGYHDESTKMATTERKSRISDDV